MFTSRSPLRALAVAFVVAACADALGTGGPASRLVRQQHLSGAVADTVPPDTTPPDTTPPPPDTAGRAAIRGIVIGVDSSVVPPRTGPVPRTVVTLFAIIRSPDSSAATIGAPTFDSLQVVMTDRAGNFFFTGLDPKRYALRAIPPSRSGLAIGATRARAVVAKDSSQVPITYLYLFKKSS